ncbi:MAG: ubiquinone/menaquinone biosynthesis methyltransferase [Candidatus Omnitrophica bacterium]|nr:Ubiquinone/menaquinone biosynthesis C-methyltransferase UbiE [bacterium]NUN95157.1 ubiquinone/menaquinone biosynthesis methyltransferase [Candidatus Omnitrophota bacterium]
MSSASTPVLPNPRSSEGKARQVRDMFSRIAPTYDLLNRLLSLGVDQRWRSHAVSHLTVPSPARVLDLCGGTGDVAMKNLKARPSDTVVVADFAYPMLTKARDRLRVSAPRHGALCGDALQLPFPDQAFEAVYCAFGVRNWSDPRGGLGEVLRVLKPGGEFIILDFFRAGSGLSDALGRLYVHHVLPLVGALISGDRHAYRYLADSMEGFCTDREFGEVVRLSGFEVTHRHRFFLGLCWLFRLRKPQ